MRFKKYTLVMLALLITFGCSEPLDDTSCSRNSDCEDGYACDSLGVCQRASDLKIVNEPLEDAFIGEAYSHVVNANGGLGDYTWSLSLAEPGDTRLDWIEIDPDTGEIRNKPGEFPAELGSNLGISVTVRDMSNRGAGQEHSQDFDVNIKECQGDQTCWEYGEDQGTWGCRQGLEACNDGVLSGLCVLTGWSTSTDHCGEGCGACDAEKADRCVDGVCVCGQTGGPCPAGETCCSAACTDLSDLTHCGACDTPCQPQNVSSASCNQGTCTYDQCDPLFYDCDGNTANGCETASGLDNCSGCGDDCTNQTLYPNTTGQSCPDGVCEYQCVLGYDDCEAGQPGCETPLGTLQNCSACGDACTGSADGGKLCIDDAGVWRCGCASETDCDSPDMCCDAVCTAHDTDHCEDCDTGCTIATGGPDCEEVAVGVYECRCDSLEDCQGKYGFSKADCSPSTHECFCQGSANCAGTPDDMCCIVGTDNECVDLESHDENCGICGAVCAAGKTCLSGACSCDNDPDCPVTGGQAQQCINNNCVCPRYDNHPCPAGQYCCSPDGCCLDTCGSPGNDCSAQCELNGYIWCDWGCCDTCVSEAGCAAAAP